MPYALPQSAPIAISAIEEEYHWVVSSKLNCLKRSNSAPFPSQPLQTPIITITSNEESKRISTSSTSKPSKSALKASSCPTSPNLTFHPQSVFPSRGRRIDRHSSRQTRQRSKSFPTLTPPSADLSASESCSSDPPTPPSDSPTSKSVRFPSDGEGKLHCVRFFKKNGRPISVSRPSEESETDYDSAGSSSASGFRYEAPSGFMNLTVPTLTRMRGAKTPFPRQRSDSAPSLPRPGDHSEQSSALLSTPNIQRFTKSTLSSYWTSASEDVEGPSRTTYELDKSTSSPVPSLTFSHDANVHLESLTLDSSRSLFLSGTILVRNVAYSKDVSVRFTLDEWTTISNVSASHVVTLPVLPPKFIQAHTLSTTPGPRDLRSAILSSTSVAEWDRFEFNVPLDHFAGDLSNRVLYLAVRYSCGQGEWWDNNGGSNYKVGFRIRSLPEGTAQAAAVSGGEDRKMDDNSRDNLPPDVWRPNGQQNSVESFDSDLHTSPTRSWSSASHSLRCHSASRPYHHDQRPSDVQRDSGTFYGRAQLLKNSYANSRLSWNCGERGLTRPSHVEALMSPIRIVSVGGDMS